jgi:hypothetical protein
MTDAEGLKHFRLALRVVGVIAIFGVYPLTVLRPSGWSLSEVLRPSAGFVVATAGSLR